MALETLEDLAKELKDEDNKNVYKIFDDFVENSNFSAEELEQKLAKEYDCFKCDSCEKFYCYDEYSFFDEECVYCFDGECDEEDEF